MAMAAAAPTNTSKYFLNPQTGGPSPPEDYLYGRNSASTSPLKHTPPSDNVSPTNYYNMHVRQLRQPRQPLYIPAALRPTERPAARDIPNRPRPLDTPPASQNNSYDGAKSNSPFGSPTVTFDGLREEANSLQQALSGTGAGFEESTGEVTGPPTTAHWKPDASSDHCSVCNVHFTWWFRRHHCRRCGNLVCENHSKTTVPLDQNARFHAKGIASKACNSCHEEWKYIRRLRHSRASSLAVPHSSSADTLRPAMPIPHAHRVADEQRVGSMARSEGGMVWSTF